MQLKNDLLLRVAQGQPVHRPPVWMMRQAGRFLTEYRAVRSKVGSFRKMIAQPEYAAEVTLQPVELIGVDAAIIFSDILVIPEAIGLPYEMVKNTGPVFPETVTTKAGLKKLHTPDLSGNLEHTLQAIRIVRKALNGRVPLIGFAGAPWTIFCYMTEGKGSKTFSIPRRLLYQDEVFTRTLLEKITEATILYLKGQIDAGAQIIQLFDSWAGLLGEEMYAKFALPYIKEICSAITEVPIIVFAKGAYHSLPAMQGLACEVIGLDWQMDPVEAARLLPGKALQGNMDPALLYASLEKVEAETLKMLRKFPAQRHIVNLGHGIYPDLPREQVQCFVDTVKNFRYIGGENGATATTQSQ